MSGLHYHRWHLLTSNDDDDYMTAALRKTMKGRQWHRGPAIRRVSKPSSVFITPGYQFLIPREKHVSEKTYVYLDKEDVDQVERSALFSLNIMLSALAMVP